MWLRNLWDTFRTISVADILDITVIACLLYLVLLWFKQTKAAFVARGIFIFAMVYVVAQQAGMYLTTWMFQGFFAIFVIALVVIFQEELRRFFERLAVWSLRRPTAPPLQPKREVEILVRSLGHFSRERVGALLVVKGRDPLERHIEGGEGLDGALSEPLLMSLFDPHSDGHDGAVVIEDGRVTRFGVHLPLSKEFGKLSGVGTRHAAALGLSEQTDALCLVVSEERGVISLARDGVIKPVEHLEALEDYITAFLREKAPLRPGAQWRDMVRRHALEKLSAVAIALGLWLVFVQGYSPASGTFKVPVDTYAVPEGMHLEAMHPAHVTVTLKGFKRDLRLLNPLSLRVSVGLSGRGLGRHLIPISENNLAIPGSLGLAKVDPPIVELELADASKTSTDSKPFLHFLGIGSTNDDQDDEADAKTSGSAAKPSR